MKTETINATCRLTDLSTIVMLAGNAMNYADAAGQVDGELRNSLTRLSLRLTNIAHDLLGPDEGQGTGDENSSA